MYPAFYRTPPQKKKPNYKYTVRIMMVILQISSEGETVTLWAYTLSDEGNIVKCNVNIAIATV